MTTALEQRIRNLEDRAQLQEVITDYLIAVDDLTSVDNVLACFTEDAVFDFSGINYPSIAGIDALRDFFTGVFADMTHHAHYNTNFKVDELNADTAKCRCHVIGMGKTKEAQDVLFYLQYFLEYRRCGDGWKISRFASRPLMPI